jgi:Winged helix-turn helix
MNSASLARAHMSGTPASSKAASRRCAAGPTGLDPKLSAAQLAQVEQALLAGTMANGFDTDLWTPERVAVVITQLTGVRYHPSHVWVILRRRLGWTMQRPERRASERDEQAIPSPAGCSSNGPGSKRGPRETGLACLLRRIGRLADPTGAPDLVAPRPHARPAAPVRLEEGLHGHCPGLPTRRHRGAAVLPPPAAELRQRPPHRGAEQLAGFYVGQCVVLIWEPEIVTW